VTEDGNLIEVIVEELAHAGSGEANAGNRRERILDSVPAGHQ